MPESLVDATDSSFHEWDKGPAVSAAISVGFAAEVRGIFNAAATHVAGGLWIGHKGRVRPGKAFPLATIWLGC